MFLAVQDQGHLAALVAGLIHELPKCIACGTEDELTALFGQEAGMLMVSRNTYTIPAAPLRANFLIRRPAVLQMNPARLLALKMEATRAEENYQAYQAIVSREQFESRGRL